MKWDDMASLIAQLNFFIVFTGSRSIAPGMPILNEYVVTLEYQGRVADYKMTSALNPSSTLFKSEFIHMLIRQGIEFRKGGKEFWRTSGYIPNARQKFMEITQNTKATRVLFGAEYHRFMQLV